jgi:hypothetical protein
MRLQGKVALITGRRQDVWWRQLLPLAASWTSAETSKVIKGIKALIALQWGRDSSIAEAA